MKKESIKIQYEDGDFSYKGSTSVEMRNLGVFLTDDVGPRNASFFKEWALDKNLHGTGGNFSTLEKEDGYILIGEEISEEPDGGPFFKISIEEFVKVLDQWEHFCKTRPKEILITKENGVIKMEGRD